MVIGVTEQSGERAMGIGRGPIAGTTDTTTRGAIDPTYPTARRVGKCTQTNP